MQLDSWVPVILALIAAVPGIFALRSQFSKDKIAERESNIAEQAAKLANQKLQLDITMSLIDPLKEQIKTMEETQEKQGKQIARLKRGVNKLITQIRELGCDPVWTPEDSEL